jgi:serine protease Do
MSFLLWRLRLLLVLVCIVIVAIVAMRVIQRSGADEGLTGIAAEVAQSVVIIELSDADRQWVWNVVGFLVEPGHLITAHHCIEGASHARVFLPSGRRYPVRGIIADGGDLDVVFLDVNIPRRRAPRLRWAESDPEPDDPIWFVARDLEDDSAFSSEGRVLQVMEDHWSNHRIITTSAPGDVGSSGSPLVNASGDVVGVVYGGFGTVNHLTAAAVSLSSANSLSRRRSHWRNGGLCRKRPEVPKPAAICAAHAGTTRGAISRARSNTRDSPRSTRPSAGNPPRCSPTSSSATAGTSRPRCTRGAGATCGRTMKAPGGSWP